jgi:hypothetical protein
MLIVVSICKGMSPLQEQHLILFELIFDPLINYYNNLK